VYHVDELSVLAAESAWMAACFCNLNSTRSEVPPLWMILFRECWTLNLNWPVFQWLIDHGADPIWNYPNLLSTPGHIATRRAVERMATTLFTTDMAAIFDLTVSSQRDNCTCNCSRQGCFHVGRAASKLNADSDHFHNWSRCVRNHRGVTQPHIFALVDKNRTAT
jgi:hypothetical protein